MVCSVDFLTKKLEEIKISDDVFLGNDLSNEKKILNKVIENFEQKIDDCEVSYYVSKRSMSICCESLTMTETIAKKLLKLTDWLMDEHFFQKNGLRELGWCSHYMLDRRSVNYDKEKQIFKKTEIVEFYWFNHSPNRFHKQQVVEEVKVCNCLHCRFFMP